MFSDRCIFCRIISGEAPARFVYQDKDIVAFHDIHSRTPVHILIVPRKHIATLNDIQEEDQALLGKMVAVGVRLAKELGVASGYRLAINTGRDGGQSVSHIHFHLFGGTRLGPPDGLPWSRGLDYA